MTRRKHFNHRSAAIPATEHSDPRRMTIIECGRAEGYVERRLKVLSDLANRGLVAGATRVGWCRFAFNGETRTRQLELERFM